MKIEGMKAPMSWCIRRSGSDYYPPERGLNTIPVKTLTPDFQLCHNGMRQGLYDRSGYNRQDVMPSAMLYIIASLRLEVGAEMGQGIEVEGRA